MQPEIIHVRWGTGYVYRGVIHINHNLISNPRIYAKVLRHEKKHWNNEKGVDWREPWDWSIFWWKLTHPSAWVDLLPVWWHGGRRFSIDWHRASFWSGIGIGLLCLWAVDRWFRWY